MTSGLDTPMQRLIFAHSARVRRLNSAYRWFGAGSLAAMATSLWASGSATAITCTLAILAVSVKKLWSAMVEQGRIFDLRAGRAQALGCKPLADIDSTLQVDRRESPHMEEDTSWAAHAYPLQQIRVELQGTRHSDRTAIIDQLETVLARLRAGQQSGVVDDDDFGYWFNIDGACSGPSIFDRPPCATGPVRPR